MGDYIITLDDDPAITRILEKIVGIESRNFASVEELVTAKLDHQPAAAFIDIHLGSEESGLSVLPTLKGRWPFCPVFVITSDSRDEAVSEALARGADDFVRKPLVPREVLARFQTRLKDQAQKESQIIISMGDIEIDRAHRLMKGPRSKCYLPPIELNLLLSLVEAKGTTLPRSALKLSCWGHIAVSDNALDRKIYEIRRSLQDVGSRIRLETRYGVGFALEDSQ